MPHLSRRRRSLLALAAGVALPAFAALTGVAAATEPRPGTGPDRSLEAIAPAREPVDVGLAGTYPADVARYVLADGVQDAQISPDGRWLAVASLLTGVRQLWLVPAAGGLPRQLTFGNGITFHRWSPDSGSLYYGADHDGNEQEAYLRIAIDGRRESLVAPAAKGTFRLFGDALPDGRRIVYASTERNGRDFDVYVRDVGTGEQRRVYEGRHAWRPAAVSPDGRWVVLVEGVGEDSHNLYLLQLADGALRTVAKPQRRASTADGGFAWLPDSSGFYYASNEGREFAALVRYDLASGRTALVETPEHDVQNVRLCGDGRWLLWTTNDDGFHRLHGRDLRAQRRLAPPALPEGVYSVSCPGPSGAAAVVVNGWRTPGDLVVWELASGRTTTAWASNLAGLDPERLIRPESVRMQARDGVEMQGLLYLPRADARRGDGLPPVVFDVHGGPTAQAMASFDGPMQYLLNRGIAVFQPNVRGSTGFGHRYVTLDDRERRLDSIRDLVDMLAWLRRDGRVDADRAAVRGGSYGGYAVNAVLAAHPGEFVAGVALFGVADWVTALQVASPSLKASDLVEYGDIDDPKWRTFYEAISPIRQADRIRVPVLYSHGVQDPRIDIFETEAMVRALRGNGIEAPYIRFEDEGHGWRKLANQLFYFRREAEFLGRQLGARAE